MIDIRPFEGLAHRDHGWLDTRFHFSFADYHDPERMGWGRIRVWNDDKIAPKSGFPPHPHRDMEIITFVRTGAITHKDSLGNTGKTGAGDVQVMSAGTGVTHAEYNLEDEDTSLFQIWILPDRAGEAPDWGQREFPRGDRSGKFEVLASGYDQGCIPSSNILDPWEQGRDYFAKGQLAMVITDFQDLDKVFHGILLSALGFPRAKTAAEAARFALDRVLTRCLKSS